MVEHAQWVARDLYEQKLKVQLQVISVHERVINLKIEARPKLLMLAHPDLPRGPACVGLSGRQFALCRELLPQGSSARFEPPGTLYLGEGRQAITWQDSEARSFAPPEYLESNEPGIRAALKEYRQQMALSDAPSAAAVLLGLNGPDPYFREKIQAGFIPLVTAVLINNKQDFKYSCRSLSGLGQGSTPTGDDLIFGALVAAHYYTRMAGAALKLPGGPIGASAKTTIMGAHMLELGRKGLASEPVIRFILSIFDGRARAELLQALMQVGSASGYEIAAAVLFTLNQLAGGEDLAVRL